MPSVTGVLISLTQAYVRVVSKWVTKHKRELEPTHAILKRPQHQSGVDYTTFIMPD